MAAVVGCVALVAIGVTLFYFGPHWWRRAMELKEENGRRIAAAKAAERAGEEAEAERRVGLGDRARLLLGHRTWEAGVGRELTFTAPVYLVEVLHKGTAKESYRVPAVSSALLTEDFDAARTVVFYHHAGITTQFCAIDRADPTRRRALSLSETPVTSRTVNTRGRTISTTGGDRLIDGALGVPQPKYELRLGPVGLGIAILCEPAP